MGHRIRGGICAVVMVRQIVSIENVVYAYIYSSGFIIQIHRRITITLHGDSQTYTSQSQAIISNINSVPLLIDHKFVVNL